VFSETDLTNFPNHHIYLKLMIDESTFAAFSAVTLANPEMEKAFRGEIIEQSRKRYASRRQKTENMCIFRSKTPTDSD